jgi:multiple sugar transport system substrate-binding protein
MRKQWGVLLLTLCLWGMSAGAAVQAAKPKVVIGTYSEPRYKIMTEMLMPEWRKDYPDIEIEVHMYPDFFNKLLVLIATDAAPDIVDTAGTFLFGHVVRDGAVDLAPYIEADPTFRADDFFPHTWEEVRYPHFEGKGIYALPYDWVGALMYYNISHFDRRGVPHPGPNWTWQDLREHAKKLVYDENGDGIVDVWGTVVDSTHLIFDPAVRSYGGAMLNPDRTAAAFDSPQAAQALELLTAIVLEDGSAPRPGVTARFEAGKSAITIMGSWEATKFPDPAGFDWATQIAPGGPVTRDIYGGSNSWEVMRRPSQDMDAVWTVLKELVSLRTVRAFTTDVARELPSRRSYVSKWPQTQLIQTLAASSAYMRNADFSVDWTPWQVAKRNEINPVLSGARSIAEGLARAAQAVNNILDAAYRL